MDGRLAYLSGDEVQKVYSAADGLGGRPHCHVAIGRGHSLGRPSFWNASAQ